MKKKKFYDFIVSLENCEKCTNFDCKEKSLINFYKEKELCINIPSIWTDWFNRIESDIMIIGQDWGPYNDMKKFHNLLKDDKSNWKNSPDGLIYKYDVTIAKNYLNKEELERLKNLTNIFLVFAEDEAKERHVMTMQDWINATDDLLKFRRKKVLDNSGNISHKQAVEKAESEYEKYRVIQDQEYVSSMDKFYNKYLEDTSNTEDPK